MKQSVWSMGVLCAVLAACGGAENSGAPSEGNSGGSGGATGGSGGSTGGVTVNTGGFHTDGGAPSGGSGGSTGGTGGVGEVDSGPPPLPPSWQTYLQIAGFARGNGVYVAVGTDMENYDDPTVDPVIYTSPDGFTWTPSATTLPSRPTDVAFGNGAFVATSQTETALRVHRSEDGSTWTTTEIPNAIPQARKGLAFGNGTFVMLATDGVFTSADGKNWKSAPRQSMDGVEFGAGKFVGWNDTQLESSKNGIDWTPSAPIAGKVKYNDLSLFGSEAGFQGILGYFCCFGEVPPKFAIVESTDAIAWKLDETRASVPAVQEAGVCITFDRSPYPLGGSSSFSAGKTCDSAKPIVTNQGFQPQVILREGPVFLLGGMAGIYSSKDGLNWEPTLIHSKQIPN